MREMHIIFYITMQNQVVVADAHSSSNISAVHIDKCHYTKHCSTLKFDKLHTGSKPYC